MPVRQMREFLDKQNVKYVTISHSRAYTAQEIAASAHIRGKELAKTVIVKVDDKMAMAVLPASYRVDLGQSPISEYPWDPWDYDANQDGVIER